MSNSWLEENTYIFQKRIAEISIFSKSLVVNQSNLVELDLYTNDKFNNEHNIKLGKYISRRDFRTVFPEFSATRELVLKHSVKSLRELYEDYLNWKSCSSASTIGNLILFSEFEMESEFSNKIMKFKSFSEGKKDEIYFDLLELFKIKYPIIYITQEDEEGFVVVLQENETSSHDKRELVFKNDSKIVYGEGDLFLNRGLCNVKETTIHTNSKFNRDIGINKGKIIIKDDFSTVFPEIIKYKDLIEKYLTDKHLLSIYRKYIKYKLLKEKLTNEYNNKLDIDYLYVETDLFTEIHGNAYKGMLVRSLLKDYFRDLEINSKIIASNHFSEKEINLFYYEENESEFVRNLLKYYEFSKEEEDGLYIDLLKKVKRKNRVISYSYEEDNLSLDEAFVIVLD